MTELFHRDEPLINEAEDQLGFTAPARWVAVLIVLRAIEQPLLRQVFSDLLSNISRVLSCEPVIACTIDAEFIHWSDYGEVKFFRESKVLATTTGSYMDDASSFRCTDVLPWYDCVNNALLCW